MDVLIKIIVAIIGIAILAAIFSKKAQTVSAIQSASSAFDSIIKIVVSPIQGK